MNTTASHQAPVLNFTFDDSLQSWNMPARDWLAQHDSQTIKTQKLDGLATAVAVFDDLGRLLLVQRAAHDSMPNKWELPGGGVDHDDPSILYGAARELFEEAGIVARRFTHAIPEGKTAAPGQIYSNFFKTKQWCRFTFCAEVESFRVRLDPNEHQGFWWATEDEIREQRKGGLALPITTESVQMVMLNAMKMYQSKRCEAHAKSLLHAQKE